jgi:uncharacterized phiE125 gp8 family phage protein
MPLSLVTAATAEPLTVDEFKQHQRIDVPDEDSLISSYLTAARAWVETATQRQLVTASWRLTMNGFYDERYYSACRDAIAVPIPPLASITSITYLDSGGTSTAWSSANYAVDTYHEPGLITLTYGASWPSTREIANDVTILFTAGYGAASAVPEGIKQAIRFLAAHWFENREPVLSGTIVTPIPLTIEALVQAHKWGSYA